MAGIGNNLYPPIISTYMPAFVRTTSCRVYFSLSDYNDSTDIANVQVIVSYQNSSLSALDSTKYPAGIKITTLNINTDIDGDDKYYITISPNDLQDEIFEIGEYYKVQLRFTSTSASALTDTSKIASWLTNNQAYFSEWSTVCLIRGIEQPLIYIRGFEEATNTNDIVFSSNIVDLVGRLYYANNSDIEDEYLKEYEVNIYHANTGELLYNTGIIYTNEFYPNEINYTLKYPFEDGLQYLIELNYTTNNLYSGNVAYYFSVITAGIEQLDATITATADEDNGRVAINIVSNNTDAYFGNLCIRRTSSETNFLVWEDIKIETIEDGQALNYTWYDYTVQGGIYYKYCAQNIDSKGNRGSVITIKQPIMLYLDDIFLTRENFQLRIRFNPSISSFKLNLIESKTDTIGSKYPYIKRNGNVAYRTFPISGLITAFCDDDHIFTDRENFYQDAEEYYDEFNEDEQITEYKDFVYEKFFRDKVMDFLHENNIKLFRSLTEGNILVRLMDISFTPNSTLGRMLYSFSATAYEMDECSIENYNKYGILTTGEYSDLIEYQFQKISQLDGTYTANQELLNLIQEQFTASAVDGYINTVEYLNWIRLDFQSDPYLIKCGTDGTLTPLPASTTSIDDNVVYGYIVYINSEPILVSARGYYELKDSDTAVMSIYFPVETEVILDYSAIVTEDEDTSRIASKLYYYKRVGQLWGDFDVNTSIFNEIFLKYLEDYSTYYQKLVSIDRMTVEAEPGTIIYVKDSFDDDYYRHEVGPTGILDFYDDEATISAAYFCGVHLNEMSDTSRLEPEDTEFRDTGIIVDALEEIDNPQKNEVYTVAYHTYKAIDYSNNTMTVAEEDTIYNKDAEQYTLLLQQLIDNSNRYIYYRNQWYVFTEDNDVLCPVEGLVDYIYELIKGEY